MMVIGTVFSREHRQDGILTHLIGMIVWYSMGVVSTISRSSTVRQ
jgi:hypothetical protein